MAQTVSIANVSYPDVPSILIPKTGGGTAQFDDTTIASNAAAAADIASGKFAWVNGTLIEGTGGGGTTWETVLSQNVQIVSSSPNYVWVDNYTEPFAANQTYRVMWGSDTYTCQTIQDTNNITYDGYYIGDMEAAGYSSTGNHEPFMIYRYKNATNVLVAATTTAAGTIFLKIEKQVSSGGSTLITKSITANGTYNAEDDDADGYSSVTVNVSGTAAKTATGTFTGNGTRQVEVTCNFEPDLVYWTSDPGTSASSGTVSCIIARGMMAANRYRNNTTTNSSNIQTPITGMNTGGSSYNFRATYDSSTSKVTLYSFSNNARNLFTSNRTYTYTFVKWTT